MSKYRRLYVQGGTYFFTCVTHRRRPILVTELGLNCLQNAIRTVQERFPFEIVAKVVLPDHWHAVWQLPEGDDRYSIRMSRIKEVFTRAWLEQGGHEAIQSDRRSQKGYRGIWQKRFWEHTVRSIDDLKRCVDYIHWNPRKHNLVRSIAAWPWSTFYDFIDQGEYTAQWGGTNPAPEWNAPEWGE